MANWEDLDLHLGAAALCSLKLLWGALSFPGKWERTTFSEIPDVSMCGALEGAGGPAQLFDIATPLGMYKVRAPEPRSQVMRKHDPLQLPRNPPSVLAYSMVFCEASVIASLDCLGRGPDTPACTNYC